MSTGIKMQLEETFDLTAKAQGHTVESIDWTGDWTIHGYCGDCGMSGSWVKGYDGIPAKFKDLMFEAQCDGQPNIRWAEKGDDFEEVMLKLSEAKDAGIHEETEEVEVALMATRVRCSIGIHSRTNAIMPGGNKTLNWAAIEQMSLSLRLDGSRVTL